MAERILRKHLPGYDRFAMNDMPREIGRKVTENWWHVARRLNSMSPEEAHSALNLSAA